MNRVIFFVETTVNSMYVIANDPTSSEKVILKTFEKWGYSIPIIVSIKRIAVEGQYGQPAFFLEAK